jgi:hypothetical protein
MYFGEEYTASIFRVEEWDKRGSSSLLFNIEDGGALSELNDFTTLKTALWVGEVVVKSKAISVTGREGP